MPVRDSHNRLLVCTALYENDDRLHVLLDDPDLLDIVCRHCPSFVPFIAKATVEMLDCKC